MASVTRRGKVCQARVRRNGIPNRTGIFDRKAEAWAREVEIEIDQGRHVDRRQADTFTLSDALGRWEAEFLHGLAVASQQSERNHLKALRQRPFGNLPLARINRQSIGAEGDAALRDSYAFLKRSVH